MRALRTAALAAALAACSEAPGPAQAVDAGPDATLTPDAAAGEHVFRTQCASCHTFGRGDRRGPDLLGVTLRRPAPWLERWLDDTETVARMNPYAQAEVARWGVTMPDPGLDAAGIADVIAFLTRQETLGVLEPLPPIALDTAAYSEAAGLYFDRCSGCHGTLRLGAIGPPLEPERAVELGTDAITATLREGRPWGMPAFGRQGVLNEGDLSALAAFLQLPVPAVPPYTLAEAVASWRLLVPVAARPTAPEHARDWENFFGVILRDAGQVAIFDGDTREELARLDTGFAPHILRASSSGRYFYAIGRDGWVSLIDLWSDPPSAVAHARGCHDARSVESSKHAGWEDRYLIEGCYSPSQYMVFDGLTLEPLIRSDVAAEGEVRVAAIVPVPGAPAWALSLKEAGQVALVDYATPGFPVVARVDALPSLHDGGLDHTGRYFLAAANAENRMAVIDLEARALTATFESGVLPHPGRGANWLDPTFGWVNATTHLGEPTLAVYGADPVGSPDHAWTVVRRLPTAAAGSLFLKTHPASPWVLFDLAQATDVALSRQICAYSKETGAIDRCFEPSPGGPALQPEFNRDGSEVWVSVWAEQGELVIYDAVTLAERGRVTGLPTPTGKFNVHNTAHDVY